MAVTLNIQTMICLVVIIIFGKKSHHTLTGKKLKQLVAYNFVIVYVFIYFFIHGTYDMIRIVSDWLLDPCWACEKLVLNYSVSF